VSREKKWKGGKVERWKGGKVERWKGDEVKSPMGRNILAWGVNPRVRSAPPTSPGRAT